MEKRIIIFVAMSMLLVGLFATVKAIGSVQGTVTDEAGNALARAKVELFYKSTRMRMVNTTKKGEYKLYDLSSGDYRIKCTLKGYEDYEATIAIQDTIDYTITLIKIFQEGEGGIVSYGIDPVFDTDNGVHKISGSSRKPTSGVKQYLETSTDQAGIASYGSPAQQNYEGNTESYAPITGNIFHSAVTEPLSTFSIDVDTANFSTIRRMLETGQLPPKSMIRIEELLNYFDYDYPEPVQKHPFAVYTELGVNPWNQQRYLAHIGIQGKSIDTKDMPQANLVFLIDVSGSMSQANKLPLVQSAMNMLLDSLRPTDRIAIVVYAGRTSVVLPSTNCEKKYIIREAIDGLSSGGSTAGASGIMLAYDTAVSNFIKGGNNRVILCTDGDFNVGATSNASLSDLISEKRDSGVFLTVLGFGMGNYKDDRMEMLADKGNGNYAYIDTIKEAEKVLLTQLSSTLNTIAKDVKIQVEFNPAIVKAYRLIGYENRMLNTEDFKDDKKDAGELGAGHTVTAIYEIIPVDSKEKIAEVDKLKYQSTTISPGAKSSGEIMTVKLRYKLPDSDTGIDMDYPLKFKLRSLAEASETFGFANSVVGFGMLLQESEHKGSLTWPMVRNMAVEYTGTDKDGYRKGFLEMIDKAADMSQYNPYRESE